MLNRENISGIIASFDEEIEELKIEAKKDYPASVRKLIENEIGNLGDNRYRYALQARALGIKIDKR